MISAVDIISYRTHEPEAPKAPPESQGPGFADYLARAQEEPRPIRDDSPKASEEQRVEPQAEQAQPAENEEPEAAKDATSKEAQESPKESEESASQHAADDSEAAATRREQAAEEAPRKAGNASARKSADEGGAKAASDSPRAEARELEKRRTQGDTLTLQLEQPDAIEEGAAETELPSSDSSTPSGARKASESKDSNELAALVASSAEGGEMRSSEFSLERRKGRSDSDRAERLDAARGRDSFAEARGKGEKPEIELVDLRSKRGELRSRGGEQSSEPNLSSPGEAKTGGVGFEAGLRQELLVIETAADGNESSGLQRTSVADSKAAAELSRALKNGGNGEILKKAQFLLKDNDQGEIRLILKPEKLGEVRIRLNLNEKHIAGRIIVENSSVREAFQENMDLLAKTFREHGFQTDGLEVSVGGRQAGEGGRRQREQLGVHPAFAAEAFDEQVPRVHIDTDAQNRVSMYV